MFISSFKVSICLCILVSYTLLQIVTSQSTTQPTSQIRQNETLNCDFESPCNWKYQDFEVAQSTLMRIPRMFMPFIDHTLQSRFGHFAYYYSNLVRGPGYAYIRGKNPYRQSNQGEICFEFYYYYYSEFETEFRLARINRDGMKPDKEVLFQSDGISEINWRRAFVGIRDIANVSSFEFSLESKLGLIAIDDIKLTPGPCNSSHDGSLRCDFELDQSCNFEPISNQEKAQWKNYLAWRTDNLRDHTLHSGGGHFYGLDIGSIPKNIINTTKRYQIQSKHQISTKSFSCFRFSYLIDQNPPPSTKLFYQIENQQKSNKSIILRKWEISGTTNRLWFTHRAPLKQYGDQNNNINIIMGIEVLLSSQQSPKVYIDDIILDESSCFPEYNCDFENGNICGMQTVLFTGRQASDEVKEFLTNLANNTGLTTKYLTDYTDQIWHVFTPRQTDAFVQHDATLRTEFGKYLLMGGTKEHDRAIFITERYSLLEGTNRRVCFKFALYKPSSDSVLEIFQGEPVNETFALKIWETRKTTKDWEVFEIVAKPQSSASVDVFFYFVGTILNKNTYLGIDDIQVDTKCTNHSDEGTSSTSFKCSTGATIPQSKVCDRFVDCPDGEDEKYCGNCKFAFHNLCNYELLTENNLAFQFRDSVIIGPESGSEFNKLFLVSNGKYGTATLRSPILHQSYLGCKLNFAYYHNRLERLPDNSIGSSFTVTLKMLNAQESKVLIWESALEPFEDNRWATISFPLGRIRDSFRIEFVVSKGSFQGTRDIYALDNIRLVDCEQSKVEVATQCSAEQFKCANNRCIDTIKVCNFEDDCGDGSDEQHNCDPNRMTSFEFGRGLWGETKFEQWKIVQAKQFDSLQDGVTYDHTSGISIGSYIYATGKSTTAQIDGPQIVPTSAHCEFSFFWFTSSPDQIIVAELQNVQTGKRSILGQASGTAYRWKRFSSKLNKYDPKSAFQVKVTTSLNDTRTYVALDDLSFSPGCTVQLASSKNHTSKPFDNCSIISCTSPAGVSICLRAELFCDFVTDCKDGLDEQNCGDCNFNGGQMCGWTDVNDDDDDKQNWIPVEHASSSTSKEMPKKDADGKADGGYVSLQSESEANVRARFRGPRLNGQTATSCKLQFSYNSLKGTSLSLRRFRDEHVTSLYSIGASKTESISEWRSYQVEIGRETAGFNLEFLARSSTRKGNYLGIALDNIRMVDCDPDEPSSSNASTVVSCDFEQNLCGWRVIGLSERSNWQRTSESKLEPGIDHTSLNKQDKNQRGTWLTTQQSSEGSSTSDVDFLATVEPLKKGQSYCLTFWFYFLAIDANSSLSLYSSQSGNASSKPDSGSDYQALWRTDLPQDRAWNQASFEISSQNSQFYLIFVAQADPTAIIGLDDIALSVGTCFSNDKLFCDFEINTCEWKIGGWKRTAASTNLPDHTTETSNGHFMKAASNEVMTKTMSSIFTFQANEEQNFNLQLYYYFSVDRDGVTIDAASKFSVSIKSSSTFIGQTISLKDTFNAGLVNAWNRLSLDYRYYESSIVQINATLNGGSTLLIDDIRFRTHYETNKYGSCDFETDLCGWHNDLKSINGKRVLWQRIGTNFETHYFRGQFMKTDHTPPFFNGHYLLLPLQMYNSAVRFVLKSPILHLVPLEGVACFRMAYFALANSTMTTAFTVNLVDLTQNRSNTIFEAKTSTVLKWSTLETEIHHIPQSFVISIESSSATQQIQSDIGLDDIELQLSKCRGNVVSSTTTPATSSEKMLNCNFETDKCNWNYDSQVWSVTNGKTEKSLYAPRLDRTFQTSTGSYLLFQTVNFFNANGFEILSSLNMTLDKARCVTFWYYEDGEDVYALEVLAVFNDGISRKVGHYSSAIENQRRWNLFKADIGIDENSDQLNKQFQLQIRYLPSSDRVKHFSVFALDDISVRPGKCDHQHDYVYTFDEGLQDLQLQVIQPVQHGIGQLYSPYIDHRPGAPPVDHSTNTDKGTYLLFANDQKIALLKTTTFIDILTMVSLPADRRPDEQSCVRFAYQKQGNVTVKVFFAAQNADAFVERNSDQKAWLPKFDKTSWTIAEINKYVPYDHQVVFYMEKTYDTNSYVALDDLTVLTAPCQEIVNCDFENGRFCSYSPLIDSTFNFGIFQAPAQDPSWPGPTYDHTTKAYGGGYLYLTAYRSASSSNKNLVSKIISGARTVDSTKRYCLSLWTSLSSTDINLKLYLLRFGQYWDDKNRTIELTLKTNLPYSDWTQRTVTLNQTLLMNTVEVQLLIEGTIGPASKGLIAIDDIELIEGQCQADGLICENGIAISSEKICNFVNDCPSGLDEFNCGDCEFNSGLCGWLNMGPKNWILGEPIQKPGKGHELFLDSKTGTEKITGELALNYNTPSMYLKAASKSCVMQFDYFVQSTRSFSLIVRVGQDRANFAPIYRITKSANPTIGNWTTAHAFIGAQFSPFTVSIVGYLDTSSKPTALGLRKIKFANCSQPKPLNANQTCPANQFACKKGNFCIENDDVCDYALDCPDGSDEQNCDQSLVIGCNFEFSLATCAIKAKNSAKSVVVQWVLQRGDKAFSFDTFAPLVDHTKRSTTGHYLILQPVAGSSVIAANNVNEFTTPMMTSKGGQNCRLRFFSFIYGKTSSTPELNIFVRFFNKIESESNSILKVKLNNSTDLDQQRWIKSIAQFSSPSQIPFQFVFRGDLGSDLSSRIAVDDITYDQNCVGSKVQPFNPTTTTKSATNTESNNGNTISITQAPKLNHQPEDNSSAGKIVAAVLTPLFVVAIVVGVLVYRKYNRSKQEDKTMVLSMKDILDRNNK